MEVRPSLFYNLFISVEPLGSPGKILGKVKNFHNSSEIAVLDYVLEEACIFVLPPLTLSYTSFFRLVLRVDWEGGHKMPAAFLSETIRATAIKLGTLQWRHDDVIGCHVDFMAAIKFKNCSKSTKIYQEENIEIKMYFKQTYVKIVKKAFEKLVAMTTA